MKELSIEEKARAYDEAIERLRNAFYDNSGRMCEEYRKAVIRIIEPIFPQLKESRDEKIREALISILKSDFEKDATIFGISIGQIITWLEKQYEQKLVEWSAEDEVMRFGLQLFLEDCEELKYSNVELGKKWVNWLKSLKGRVQPQNRWKESIATADLENSLCDIQDGLSDTSYEYRILGEAIEFIRCTEAKPRWKPSEEQMQFLLKYAEQSNYDGAILTSLYQDLKKLKG